jgi:ankyrin repeat protein
MSVDFELTPLQKEMMDAIGMGRADMVEDCLTRGAGHWFPCGYSDERPLHIAAQKGHADIIRLLVEKGAKVDMPDEQGHTPLFHAADKGMVEAVATLLDLGADIHHISHTSRTALFGAAMRNHTEVIELLLDRGADPNATVNGSTALFYAVGNGHYDAVKLLVERGARTDVTNAQNETPADVALRSKGNSLKGDLLTSFLAAALVEKAAKEGAQEHIIISRPLKLRTSGSP